MAIRNKATVYINGRNYTFATVMPIKWGNLLDERLDEMYLSLRKVKKQNFAPLTPVEIHFSNQLYFGSTDVDAPQTATKRYIIADDANVTENPVGSGWYDHDLYLIELTKLLECVIVDTNTVTNDLGRNYLVNAIKQTPRTTASPDGLVNTIPPITPDNYTDLLPAGTFYFVSAKTIFPYAIDSALLIPWGNTYTQEIYSQNNELIGKNVYEYNHDGVVGQDIGLSISLISGQTYRVVYTYHYEYTGGSIVSATISATYTFIAVQNEYPLKRWTITDVINRLCDIAEPLRLDEKPRFRLQGTNYESVGSLYQSGSQAERFDKVLAPQFSFTKSTLRECLQQCGKIIHGEPRVDIAQDTDGTYFYEISFDLYGQTDRAGVYTLPYIQKTVSQVIDSYASYLDSNAENLVNQLDKYSGVIVEPYDGGFKTVRTETLYVRITDANMLIQTQYPIYSIEKLECGYISQDGGTAIPPADITPYVFESSIYNTRLSSYEDQYPYSKAYALYYTQGQKNIQGLNFKPEHPVSSVFENYAILNILNRVTGQDVDVPQAETTTDGYLEGGYPLLAFRVTYIPFYTSRVGQTKVNYQDFPVPAALIYNQQANVIESRYYGENLKGAIARIGNVEKSVTYNILRLRDIPRAGQLYDEEYYISAVSVEFLPTYIKCTLGLSKDFNRLSQYIGISSVKRFSEVSQGQAVERNTLWREYIVVGDDLAADADTDINLNVMAAVRNTFLQSSSFNRPLTCVLAYGGTWGGTDDLPVVALPVVSSAFGNSIAFSWEYEDNYSAGAVSQYAESGGGTAEVTGYFQNNYQYTDYYGRMYFYNFEIRTQGEYINDATTQAEIGTELPRGNLSWTGSTYIETYAPRVLRKDNREKLQCNFQIDFVSNRKGLIIGSALAAYCPLVRGIDSSLAAKLYIFDEPLNKFINHVEGSLDIDFTQATGYDIRVSELNDGGQFTVSVFSARNAFPAAGKAWAICTQQHNESETVEDEQGHETTQIVQYGGDVLVAQNMDFAAGDAFPTVYFTKKREVFDKTVWIANK